MDVKDRCENTMQRFGLICDAFTAGYLAMCLLLFVPYVAAHNQIAVTFVMPLVCLFPFAAMPFAYVLIHRMDTLLFGRYHFVMPVAAFVAAPLFVVLWSADNGDVASSCAIFFGALVFANFITVYRYCSFSVRARLSGASMIDKSAGYEIFAALGTLSALCVFLGFWHYDCNTAYVNTAYVIASVCLVLAVFQYLATFYGIPKLGGKRVQSVKSAFRSFFCEFEYKTYFSALFFLAAYAVIAALAVYFAMALGVSVYRAVGAAVIAMVVYAVSAYIVTRRVRYRSMALSVINLVCVIVPCMVFALLAALHPEKELAFVSIVVCDATAGFGCAVALRQSKLRFFTVKPRITGSVVYILLELTLFAAAAIAIETAAIVLAVFNATGSATAFIYGYALAAALCIAAFALASKRHYNSAQPGQSYEIAVTNAAYSPEENSQSDC